MTSKIQDIGIDVADKLGVVRPLAKAYDSVFGIEKFPEVENKIRNYEMADKKGEVLIPLVMGRNDFGTYTDCILAHAFRVRGYEPTILLCDQNLDMCLAKQWTSSERAACEICNFMGTEFLQRFGLEYTPLADFDAARKTYDASGKEYRGVDIDGVAISSTRAYLKIYNLDRFPESEAIYNRFKKSAKMLTDVAFELFQRGDYDAVMSNNSAYLVGSVFLRVGKQFDVPSWDIDVGFRSQSVLCGNASNRSSLPTFPDQNSASKRLETPLTDEELATIEEFMQDRMAGKGVLFDHAQLSSDTFTLQNDDTTFGAFTNLPWDGSLTATNQKAFEDVFTWIDETVSIFTENPDLRLYIKTHPAEVLRTTNESFYDYLTEEHSLPENIEVLPPDTSTNPYEFMAAIDRGLVWNSTTGLEMSYLGVPVIVSGDTHYRGYGFTFDPADGTEYRDFILREDLELTTEMNRLAKRYAHHLFIERHINFPYYDTVTGDFRPVTPTHDELTRGNTNIDLLINSILDDNPVPETRKAEY